MTTANSLMGLSMTVYCTMVESTTCQFYYMPIPANGVQLIVLQSSTFQITRS